MEDRNLPRTPEACVLEKRPENDFEGWRRSAENSAETSLRGGLDPNAVQQGSGSIPLAGEEPPLEPPALMQLDLTALRNDKRLALTRYVCFGSDQRHARKPHRSSRESS